MPKCEHRLRSTECYTCASPKHGAFAKDHGPRTVTPATILQGYDTREEADFACQVLLRMIEDLKTTHTVIMRVQPSVNASGKQWIVRARIGFDQIQGKKVYADIDTRQYKYGDDV